MKLVEQALFTSIETNRPSRYQIVAGSVGIHEADVPELVAWEPSRDLLLEMGADAESINFHPLPSGAYSISRTVPAGWEHGGSRRMFTHCLIVPPEILLRFANNPIALARSMTEHNLWQKPASSYALPEAFLPPDSAMPVDQALLRRLTAQPGADALAALVQAARDAVCLAVVGVREPRDVISGLFNCLPLECRLDFSFSTGLKFSPRRPFRVVILSDDPAERLWAINYPNVTILDLGNTEALHTIPADGWTRLVERTLTTEHLPFFASQISKPRFDLSLDDLPVLGLQLMEDLDESEARGEEIATPTSEDHRPIAAGLAHAAHRQFAKSAASSVATRPQAPSAKLGLYAPESLEKLERLDDLVYEAIAGSPSSFEQLQSAWPLLVKDLTEEALAESREQYLRYALSVWEECIDAGVIRDPARAIQVLDVLCMLFGVIS